MPRRQKMSDAYKKLRSAHRKGPKRVKNSRPRRSKGYDPLSDPKHARRIQICLDYTSQKQNIVVVIFHQAFNQLKLVQGKTYNMDRDRLTNAAKILRKTFESWSHNDFILQKFKELKIGNVVGRCFVFAGTSVEDPDATLRIGHTQEERQQREAIRARVAALFSK